MLLFIRQVGKCQRETGRDLSGLTGGVTESECALEYQHAITDWLTVGGDFYFTADDEASQDAVRQFKTALLDLH